MKPSKRANQVNALIDGWKYSWNEKLDLLKNNDQVFFLNDDNIPSRDIGDYIQNAYDLRIMLTEMKAIKVILEENLLSYATICEDQDGRRYYINL